MKHEHLHFILHCVLPETMSSFYLVQLKLKFQDKQPRYNGFKSIVQHQTHRYEVYHILKIAELVFNYFQLLAKVCLGSA